MADFGGATSFIFQTLLYFLGFIQMSSCFSRSLQIDEILASIETSCIVAVTEHASINVYHNVQYLADVSFVNESGVVLGYIQLQELLDKGHIQTKDTLADIVYFRRKAKERTCLSSPPPLSFTPRVERYQGPEDVDSLTSFINNVCDVYRVPNGGVSLEGIHRDYILHNMFHVKNLTSRSMGVLYAESDSEKIPLWQTKGDNSSRINQCTDSGEYIFTTLVEKDILHAKQIVQCEVIDTLTFEDFFKNYLQISKPVIIKNAISTWPAIQKWTNSYLREQFGHVTVHVKVTPSGEYEGVEPAYLWEDFKSFQIPKEILDKLPFPDLVVVRPAVVNMKFSEFLDIVERVSNGTLQHISAYLEYTSLAQYFGPLKSDVKEMPFVSDSLKLSHQNIWLSDGNTLGKLHFDPFDNFLCQLSGKKEVILFDPHDNGQLYEGHIPEAILEFDNTTLEFRRKTLMDSTSMVMSPVNILQPDFQRFPRFANVYPMNCTIDEGDVLYLPAFWWHEVQSFQNKTAGRNLALNYWYEPFLTREFPCPECQLDVNPFYRHLL